MQFIRLAARAARTLCITGFLALAPGQAHAQLHEYALTHGLNDLHGGPALSSLGGLLEAGGYRFQRNQGLSLDVNLGSSWSIVLRSAIGSTADWNKIVDFDNGQEDSGYYVWNGQARYHNIGRAAGPAYVDNQFAVTVLTRTADGQLAAYVNGVRQFLLADPSGLGIQQGLDPLRFFVDDVNTQTESSAGIVSYIGLYDEALTAEQVAALTGTPTVPVNQVPEPNGALLMLAAAAGLFVITRRRAIA